MHRTHDQVPIAGEKRIGLPVEPVPGMRTDIAVGIHPAVLANDEPGQPEFRIPELEATRLQVTDVLSPADDDGTALVAAQTEVRPAVTS